MPIPTNVSLTKDDQGFMKVYHFVTMKLIRQRLNGCEHCIVLLLLRMTAGYQREETPLSQKFVAQCTGYHKTPISRAMANLVNRNIIIRTGTYGFGTPAKYKLNMDIEEWVQP